VQKIPSVSVCIFRTTDKTPILGILSRFCALMQSNFEYFDAKVRFVPLASLQTNISRKSHLFFIMIFSDQHIVANDKVF